MVPESSGALPAIAVLGHSNAIPAALMSRLEACVAAELALLDSSCLAWHHLLCCSTVAQTPLSVSSRDSSLIQSRNAYHAVSRTLEGTYSLDAIVNAVGAAPSRCTNRADDVNNKQSVTVHRRRLSLRGDLDTARVPCPYSNR